MPDGSIVGGAASRTSAPSFVNAYRFERATRECVMSPMIVTVRPSKLPFSCFTVKQSSSAWVGCSCAPSPALITGAASASASRLGTPATLWRTITASGSIASSVIAVSRMLSALVRLDDDGVKLTTSAESRFPAISKLVRVRVDDSKNRLISVRPRSVGTFLTSRRPTSCIRSAVSRMRSRSARSRSSMPSRSLPVMHHPRLRRGSRLRAGLRDRPQGRAVSRALRAVSGRSCRRSRS